MKNLNRINCFMVGFPPVLFLIGWLYEETFLYIAIWFAFLTCGCHFIGAITILLMSGFKNNYIKIYFLGAAIFFIFWVFTNVNWEWIVVILFALAIYMSILLFIEAKKETYAI